jgi:hypothetical protein
MPTEWQFVPTTGDGKVRDRNAKTLVRSAAMRAFRRNERLERISKLESEESKRNLGSPRQASTSVDWETRWSGWSSSGGATTEEEDSDLQFQWISTIVDIGPAVTFDPFVSTTLYSNRDYIKLFTRCK